MAAAVVLYDSRFSKLQCMLSCMKSFNLSHIAKIVHTCKLQIAKEHLCL